MPTFQDRRKNLIEAINKHAALKEQLVETPSNQLDPTLKDKLKRLRDTIEGYVNMSPRLARVAHRNGWDVPVEAMTADTSSEPGTQEAGKKEPPKDAAESGTYTGGDPRKDEEPDAVSEIVTTQGDDPTRPGGKDKDKEKTPNLRGQAADNRLLGEKGEHYVIRRGPAGAYLAVYSFKIEGETFKIAVQIPKGKLGRYGVKEGEGKLLTKAQMKNVHNIGWADELSQYVRQGDGHMVKALERYLRNQYGGNPMLQNDEVMATVISNSLFGWQPGEFEQQLRNTKWYNNTNGWQRTWDTTMSATERRQITDSTLQKVVNSLEATYGFDWMTKIEGGMGKAKKWAEQIASGKWGTPDDGLGFWGEKQFDKAVEIQGTPAWISRQKQEEADRSYLNRPEDKSEQLRQDMLARFGRVIVGKKERDSWATDIVTGVKPESDWEDFMRQQMKTLYPEMDPNIDFTAQGAPFKAMLEQTMGTPVGWDHPLLTSFAGLDDNGKPTGSMMSLYDYQLKIRDPDLNPSAYEQGTPLYDQSADRLAGILKQLRGVA